MADIAVVQTSSVLDKAARIDELKAFIRKERDARQVKKALAVKLLYEGYGYEGIVEILNVSLGAICEWKQLYESSGLGGFVPKHKGKKGYLSETEKAAVIAWLKTKDIWTLGELESHLAEVYAVVYASKQSYYDLFEAAGISWKKTSKVNPKGDTKVVAAKKPTSSAAWHATEMR
ncbi:MAG: winged helix-turn-helix domain-containing protein [Cyanobacteria bacterium P01_D01_bin.36]